MKKRLTRRIKRIGRAQTRRRPPRRAKSPSAKKRARLEAADILLLLCLFALLGGIALLLYLHFAKGLVF